ncbi:hypothetical protein ABZR88_19985 [Mucilaginibacter yixingensis]|nr:tetratricopeptide repeat protein [Mucilaginibacter yixingensis]
MRALDTLRQMATQWNDLSLQCAVLTFRADYYSATRGFNQQSIDYYQQAIEFAVSNELPIDEAISLQKKASYLFTFSRNTDACQCFLQAYEKFRQIGFKNVPNLSQYLAEQANFYYSLKDYDSAGTLLKQALDYPLQSERARINIINTLGLIYRNQSNYKDALNYFSSARNYAVASKDTAWLGIINGNIGSVYFRQNKYAQAEPLIRNDYETSIRFKDSVNAGTALLRLSRINIERSNLKLSEAELDTAEKLTVNKKFAINLISQVELNRQRAEVYQKSGRLAFAIKYSKQYEILKDSLNKRDNIVAVENVRLKWVAERHQAELEQLRNRGELSKFKRNAVIVILVLTIAVVSLLFNRYRSNARKNQQLLLAEKRRVDEELGNAVTLLKQYTENLKQNNAIIEKFKSEIANFKADSTDRKTTENLEKLLQARIMTDETWDEFKKLFSKVHGGFFTRLRKSYPNLTDTDTRLLSLLKLGLNNREMANMLGVTIEGVKKSKQRMRKKMELPAEAELEQVIANI